jgi:hypothetical protein
MEINIGRRLEMSLQMFAIFSKIGKTPTSNFVRLAKPAKIKNLFSDKNQEVTQNLTPINSNLFRNKFREGRQKT